MLKYDNTTKVLKDSWSDEKGWVSISIRAPNLKPLIGQNVPYVLMLDEDHAHNPKSLVATRITREAPGIYKVNEHFITFRPKFTCDCEFYQYSKGNMPCKHMLAVLKQILADKKF